MPGLPRLTSSVPLQIGGGAGPRINLTRAGAAGRGLAAAGKALAEVAATIDKTLDAERERQQRLTDATATIETITGVGEELEVELDRRRRETDTGSPSFARDFNDFAKAQIEDRLAALPQSGTDGAISDEAQVLLKGRLAAVQSRYFRRGLAIQATGRAAKAGALLDSGINALAAGVRRAPTQAQAGAVLEAIDAMVAEFGGDLSAEVEIEARRRARVAVLGARVRGWLDLDDFEAARTALDDPGFDADLSPAGRDQLIGEIAVAERQAKARARAATNERARRVARAVDGAVFVLEAGRVPPELEGLRAQAAEFPELEGELAAGLEDAGFMAEFTRLAPAAQAEAIGRLDRQATSTRREVRRLDRMVRGHAGALDAIRSDPLGYAASIDAIAAPEQLAFDDPATLARRAAQAEAAGDFLGIPVPPLRPAEVAALRGAIDDAPPEQVAALFGSLGEGFGEAGLDGIADQLAPKRPALAVALSRAALSPGVAAEIVAGGRLLRDNADAKPTASEAAPAIADLYENLFQEVPGALAAYREAAFAIYAGRKVPSGDFAFDETLFEDALRLAAGGRLDAEGKLEGGPLIFNGQTILPPLPGMGEDALGELVEGLSVEDLARFGNGAPAFDDGTPFAPELFDFSFIRKSARLLTVGPGRYRVFLEDLGYAVVPDGAPYVIDLRAAARAKGLT